MSPQSVSVARLFDPRELDAVAAGEMREVQCLLGTVRDNIARHGKLVADDREINAIFAKGQTEASAPRSKICPVPYLAELSDVMVHTNSGTVISGVGLAMNDELAFVHAAFAPEVKCRDLVLTPKTEVRLKFGERSNVWFDCGVALFNEYQVNYFHWVAELLPRLALCERLGIDPDIPLLVRDGLHRNFYDILDLVRHPSRKVIKLPVATLCPVKRLIHISDLSRVLTFYDRPDSIDTAYLANDHLAYLASLVKGRVKAGPVPQKRRLFLKRISDYRELLNQAEIERCLVERDFEVLDLANMSIRSQIEVFNEARVIVGPSGASLTNMMWCQPATRALVLHSNHPYKNFPYWAALARLSGIDISYLAGPRALVRTDMYAVHDDYSIDIGAFVERLDPLLRE